jgi:hypothetical protein
MEALVGNHTSMNEGLLAAMKGMWSMADEALERTKCILNEVVRDERGPAVSGTGTHDESEG